MQGLGDTVLEVQGHGKSSRVLPCPPGLSPTEASHLPSRVTTALELWLPLHVLRNFFLSINLSFPFLPATSLGLQVDSDPFNLISFKKRKKKGQEGPAGGNRETPSSPLQLRHAPTPWADRFLQAVSAPPLQLPLSDPTVPLTHLLSLPGLRVALPALPTWPGLPCLVPHKPMCSFLASCATSLDSSGTDQASLATFPAFP